MKQSFKEFLQENMLWADFEHLDEHLGESARMTTFIIDQSSSPKKLHVEKIVQLINKVNKNVTADQLALNFNFAFALETV